MKFGIVDATQPPGWVGNFGIGDQIVVYTGAFSYNGGTPVVIRELTEAGMRAEMIGAPHWVLWFPATAITALRAAQ